MTILSSLFETVGEQLDGIIDAYRRGVVPEHPETIVTYRDGTVSSYNIVGTFTSDYITNRSYATKVEIGNTVTNIDGFGDYSWNMLSSVIIPSSVTSIKTFAFYMTMELKEITIPKTVTSIEGSAFSKSAFETIIFEDRTISEVQSMQNYSSWGLDEAPSALGTFQRTIVCSDGTFTVTVYNHGGPE